MTEKFIFGKLLGCCEIPQFCEVLIFFIDSILLVQCNSVALASFQTPDQILTCCTETHKCGDGEGNCDMNVQCEGDLVCGHNNCNNDFPINQLTNMKFSCCYNPGESVFILFPLQWYLNKHLHILF